LRGSTSAFAHTYVKTAVLEEAIDRFANGVADRGRVGGDGARENGAAHSLLMAATPALRSGAFAQAHGEPAVDFAVRIADDLGATVLPIQGPPGSGKTYCGAEMICALVKEGKKVGVTATGHKVIRNLLKDVAKAAAKKGLEVSLAHKSDGEEADGPETIEDLSDNGKALAALESGAANVLGGTAWLWARPEFAGAVDVLFVDEAGQMSLANVLAVSAAAKSIVLLGDPQQLDHSSASSAIGEDGVIG